MPRRHLRTCVRTSTRTRREKVRDGRGWREPVRVRRLQELWTTTPKEEVAILKRKMMSQGKELEKATEMRQNLEQQPGGTFPNKVLSLRTKTVHQHGQSRSLTYSVLEDTMWVVLLWQQLCFRERDHSGELPEVLGLLRKAMRWKMRAKGLDISLGHQPSWDATKGIQTEHSPKSKWLWVGWWIWLCLIYANNLLKNPAQKRLSGKNSCKSECSWEWLRVE